MQEQNPGLALEYVKKASELGSVEAKTFEREIEEGSGLYPCKMSDKRLQFISQLIVKLDPGFAKYLLMCRSATSRNVLIGIFDCI